MDPINRNAIGQASTDRLEAWLGNLATATETGKPTDMTDRQYDETTYWIAELSTAIRTEIDRRRESNDNHGLGPGRIRAAI